MTLDDLLARLDGARQRGNGRWIARCIAHEDRSPSLSVSEGERGLLVKCWAGCSIVEICARLGIEQRDLFYDSQPNAHGHQPAPRPMKMHHVALAFRYELAALDLRLRVGRIIEVGTRLAVVSLNDGELDRAMNAVGNAYDDMKRAELFEQVADDLRMKEWMEREHEQHRHLA